MRNAYLIFKNELLVTIRNPFWIFFGLFQPIVYLLLFAPFLKGIASAPGFPTGDAIQFFAPGLLIMNAMFNAGFSGFGLLERLQSGFVERLRVTPISRISIAVGFSLLNSVTVLVQSALLIGVASLLGLNISFLGAVVLSLLLLLVALTMSSISYSLALLVKDGGIMAGITNFFTLPLLLLSGTMLPVAFAPKILQTLANYDPFKYSVDAARALINGGVGESSVLYAFIIFGVLAILSIIWFIRVMREAVA